MHTTVRRRFSTVTATLLVVVGACSSSTSPTPAPPRSLDGIEAASEDVIDQVPRERWKRIDAAVSTMRRSWREYRREAMTVDATQAARLARALRDLTTSSGRRDGLGTQQAANDASAPVVELLDHYALGRPVQIGRLDVLGRQVVIDVRRSDEDRTRADVRAVVREWTAVRASVGRRDGARVVSRTDRAVRRLVVAAASSDGRVLELESNDLLELVDDMERLYRRPPRRAE